MGLFTFSGLTSGRINDLTELAMASYDAFSPPSGWRTLIGSEIGFRSGFNTGTYDGTTFEGGQGFFGLPAAETYADGNSLVISFRGTNSIGDYATYPDILGNNNYINAFNSFLQTVADYVDRQGISDISVTGHSLGAAAVNILRDVSNNRYDGAFQNATYVAVATPKVAANLDILNIGYENDWVFEAIPRITPFVPSDFFSATDNIIYYDDEYASDSWPGFLNIFDFTDVSAHAQTAYIDGVSRVLASPFYSLMTRDSNVVIVATNTEVTDKDTVTSDHFGDPVFYIGREQADIITGNDDDDYFDGMSGNDTFNGGGGNDTFDGGKGNDLIDGGSGNKDKAFYSGDFNDYELSLLEDFQVRITDNRGADFDGTDTLKNIEFARFADQEISLSGVDIVFVIDSTGSMSDDIAAVKAQATQIISQTIEKVPLARFATVTYKDPGQTRTNGSFTNDVEAARAGINSIFVSGGGDFPEGVNSGLLHALTEAQGLGDWRPEPTPRSIILIGDAPAKDTELRSQVISEAKKTSATIDERITLEPLAATFLAASDAARLTVAADISSIEPSPLVADDDAELISAFETLPALPVGIYPVIAGRNSSTIADFEELAVATGGKTFAALTASDVVEAVLAAIDEAVESPVEPPADILGTDGDDTIIGTDADEVINALAGDDVVAGGLGNDEIFGGDGEDVLRGDLNQRSPQGSTIGGNDIIYGGAGNDRIGGKAGNDELFGGEGDDKIWGDDGDDLLRGGLGDDILTGDDFSGGSGSDIFILAAGEGADTIVDFELGIDFIGLAEGLSFGALTLMIDKRDTLIQFEASILARVANVTALSESSFIAV